MVTHKELVKAGARWLGHKYRVVATELSTAISETPDVIGWDSRGYSAVIECKTSHSDFINDKNKTHARSDSSVGDERWYLAPEGIIDKSELPEAYGLLVYKPSNHKSGHYIQIAKRATPIRRECDRATRCEKTILVSLAWRALEACTLVKPITLGNDENPID